MAEKLTRLPVRLAMRVEGDWWVAYLAQPDTMKGAVEMGRICRGLFEDEKVKREWQQTLTDWMARAVEEKTGQTPEMITEPAPEPERSGSA